MGETPMLRKRDARSVRGQILVSDPAAAADWRGGVGILWRAVAAGKIALADLDWRGGERGAVADAAVWDARALGRYAPRGARGGGHAGGVALCIDSPGD